MLTRTDPNGVTTTWTYTPLNQAATVTYSGSSAHSVSYAYDANGNRTAMTDATGSLQLHLRPVRRADLRHQRRRPDHRLRLQRRRAGHLHHLPAARRPRPGRPPAPSATATTTPTGLTSVTDFNGHQITITNTADGLPGSETLGSTGDTITTTYDPTDQPVRDHAEERHHHPAVLHLLRRARRDHPHRDRHPVLARSPAVYTYDARAGSPP